MNEAAQICWTFNEKLNCVDGLSRENPKQIYPSVGLW